jgi:hypothetical protein
MVLVAFVVAAAAGVVAVEPQIEAVNVGESQR